MNDHKKLRYKLDNATKEDGPAIHKLVGLCPSLDQNSRYLYLLLCSHFNKYTLTAKAGNRLIGFVSAYKHPKLHDTIFIWQIAIASAYRKQGVASKIIERLVQIAIENGLSYVEATVTPSNRASFNMFKKIADTYGAHLQQRVYFPESLFDHIHEEEILIRIGPMKNPKEGELNENI